MIHLHNKDEAPSPWVCRFAPLIPARGKVLDLACGSGRHARWLAEQGWQVEAVDRDGVALAKLSHLQGITPRVADLEQGAWPYHGRSFDGIIVSRYLHRPLLPLLADALGQSGVLIYETFMLGNERFGSPKNPDFLLRPDELLKVFGSRFSVVAFEQGEVQQPRPAVMQRICVTNSDSA
jgi:SAM-dependent methyltransferase